MPEDDGHSADTCDVEGGPFRMIPILDYEVYDFGYVAHFIKGSVHIIDRDHSGELLGTWIFDHTNSMSMNCAVAPKSMRVFISIRVLLPMICSGSSIPLHNVVEHMRTGVRSGVYWRTLGAQLSWFLDQQLVTEGLTYLL